MSHFSGNSRVWRGSYADGQLNLAFQGGEPTLEQICGLPDGGEDALHVAGEYRRLRQLYR